MRPVTVKRLRLLGILVGIVLLFIAALGAWFHNRLRASLPLLDGSVRLAGLTGSVTVERDALGVPTVRGGSRPDVARALGYLHAQDRFFQMDCSRRHAAGELSELFGKATLPHDRAVRIHDFRSLARRVLADLSVEQKALLESYAAGVNAGLADLKARPFEYYLLRETPRPWLPEDSLLMIYAMALDLQDSDASYERSLSVLNDTLGRAALAYFAPLVGPDDAANDATAAPLAPMPTERMIDIRRRVYEYEGPSKGRQSSRTLFETPEVLPGSNAFVVDGTRTSGGAAMIANDMHLALRLPNTWYRASLVFPSTRDGAEVRITGVTLPGTPLVVAGSNGSIAWGFTNSYADTTDLVIINNTSAGPTSYSVVDDIALYETRSSVIQVRGEKPDTIDSHWTIWGPIIGQNADRRDLALNWTLHDPQAVNLNLLALENARTVQEAVAIARETGIPPQNFLVADTSGAIAWTICGRLPRREGFDGRLPASRNFGDRRWNDLLPAAEVPVLINPPGGRIWSGNQRMLGGTDLEILGDGGYEHPMRAARIRDLLEKQTKSSTQDLLAVQLDIHAPGLERWKQLLVQTLGGEQSGENAKDRIALRLAAEKWTEGATAESVGHRAVAAFRRHVVERVLPVIFEPCYDAYPEFNFRRFHYEPALWDMIATRPPHLLGQDYSGWEQLLLAAADDTVAELKQEHGSIARAAWGSHNTANIHHPLARLFPGFLSRWLRAPADPLPGGRDMPRVQSPDNGASERFSVSPGREAEGLFHMPGGQSGHPLSPWFLAGHEAWVKGEPTPFIPGKTVHTLHLTP